MYIFDQLKRIHSKRKITFWYGARSLREMFYDDEFKELQKTQADTEKSWVINASDIDSDTCDLSVKNPNTPDEAPLRAPDEILAEMEQLDAETKNILGSIKELL